MIVGSKYIAVVDEGGDISGNKRIYSQSTAEPLEDIIKEFLKTGKLSYTCLLDNKKIDVPINKSNNKLVLWEAIGRFRCGKLRFGSKGQPNLKEWKK